MKQPQINIAPAERLGRIVLGGAATITGAWLLLSTGGGVAIVVVVDSLLVFAGLDLVVTGALGHCPLYQKLGHVPKTLRRSP